MIGFDKFKDKHIFNVTDFADISAHLRSANDILARFFILYPRILFELPEARATLDIICNVYNVTVLHERNN